MGASVYGQRGEEDALPDSDHIEAGIAAHHDFVGSDVNLPAFVAADRATGEDARLRRKWEGQSELFGFGKGELGHRASR